MGANEYVSRVYVATLGAVVAGATVKVAVPMPSGHDGYITQLAIEMGVITADGSVLLATSDGRVDESAVTNASSVAETEWCTYEPTIPLVTTDSGLLAYGKTFTIETAAFRPDQTKYFFMKSLSTFAMDAGAKVKVVLMLGVP